MSFDAWVVGFGISTLLRQLHLVDSGVAFAVLASAGLIDTALLYRFFRQAKTRPVAAQTLWSAAA